MQWPYSFYLLLVGHYLLKSLINNELFIGHRDIARTDKRLDRNKIVDSFGPRDNRHFRWSGAIIVISFPEVDITAHTRLAKPGPRDEEYPLTHLSAIHLFAGPLGIPEFYSVICCLYNRKIHTITKPSDKQQKINHKNQ